MKTSASPRAAAAIRRLAREVCRENGHHPDRCFLGWEYFIGEALDRLGISVGAPPCRPRGAEIQNLARRLCVDAGFDPDQHVLAWQSFVGAALVRLGFDLLSVPMAWPDNAGQTDPAQEPELPLPNPAPRLRVVGGTAQQAAPATTEVSSETVNASARGGRP